MDDFVRPESQPLEFGEDYILKFGPHDYEVEAEDQAAVPDAVQHNGRNSIGSRIVETGGLAQLLSIPARG
jgi:hypothetical protein